MAYATLAQLKTWLGVGDSDDDTLLTTVLASAERAVSAWAGNSFNESTSAARTFNPASTYEFRLPAGSTISSTTGLTVKTDTTDNGTFDTTWTITTDFVLEPYSGIGADGSTGWPYNKLLAVGSKTFQTGTRRPTLQITATWGWAAVPSQVTHATLIVAAELAKLKDAPFGVAGFGDLGLIRIRENPKVRELLAIYQHGMHAAVIA